MARAVVKVRVDGFPEVRVALAEAARAIRELAEVKGAILKRLADAQEVLRGIAAGDEGFARAQIEAQVLEDIAWMLERP